MPDAALFALAEQGQLGKPSVLREQVRRMLKDPKAKAFSRNFAAQWLDLAGIRRLAVNPEYFVFEETRKIYSRRRPFGFCTMFCRRISASIISFTQILWSSTISWPSIIVSPELAAAFRCANWGQSIDAADS